MAKIKLTKRRVNSTLTRVLSLLLAVVMLLASINLIAIFGDSLAFPTAALAEETLPDDATVRSDAMHFIIRHWHTDIDYDTKLNDPETQHDEAGDSYFVLVEGYIVPILGADSNADKQFDIYLVNQNDGNLVPIVDGSESSYVDGAPNFTKGAITIKVKVRTADEDELEVFSGLSVSTGRNAITTKTDDDGNITGIVVTYASTTHLTKAHVFYTSKRETVRSTNDPAVFKTDNPNYYETDTATVYTYTGDEDAAYTCPNGSDDNDSKHPKTHVSGDIVKYVTEDGEEACWNEGDLWTAVDEYKEPITYVKDDDGVKYKNVELTKFYSTNVGLHTDKILITNANGEAFLLSLQAWYTDGYAAQMSFLIDASGSMAFAYETPTQMNVYAILSEKLGAVKKTVTIKDTEEEYEAYFYYEKDENTGEFVKDSNGGYNLKERFKTSDADLETKLKDLFKEIATDLGDNPDEAYLNGSADTSAYINLAAKLTKNTGTTVSTTDLKTLFSKIGSAEHQVNSDVEVDKKTYAYPQRDSLIGYYSIQANNWETNYRTWYFNAIDTSENNDGIRPFIKPSSVTHRVGTTGYVGDEYFGKAVYPQVETTDGEQEFDFGTTSQTIRQYSDFNTKFGVTDSTGWGSYVNFAGGKHAINLAGGTKDSGYMLSESSSPTGDFTLSFEVERVNTWKDDTEILYIGGKSGTIGTADFRLVYKNDGNKIVLYHGENETELTKCDTTKQTYTFTYDEANETLKFYVNGALIKTVYDVSFNLKDSDNGKVSIVFDPFKDNASGGSNTFYFYVGNIFVYDTALTRSEIEQLITTFGAASSSDETAGIDSYTTTSGKINWNAALLGDELDFLLNPNNTDNRSLGFNSYSYYVLDDSSYKPLGYWDGIKSTKTTYRREGTTADQTLTIAQIVADNGEVINLGSLGKGSSYDGSNLGRGWYFVTSAGSMTYVDAVGTSKRMLGTVANASVTDPDTGEKFTNTVASATKFYVDSDGNLRCFYSSGDNIRASHVYEMDDKQYTRIEAAQRILANFSTKFSELSPTSYISAVQYSSDNYDPDGDERQILLDWTSNPVEVAKVLSITRGTGKASDYEEGNNTIDGQKVKQYNYVLTGSTSTYLGFQSYNKYLAPNVLQDSPKFIVIFTDGVDSNTITDRNKLTNANNYTQVDYDYIDAYGKEQSDSVWVPNNTVNLAKALKDDGYTIAGVLFAGNDLNNQEQAQAEAFFSALIGTSDDKGLNGSTINKNTLKNYYFPADQLGELINLFNNQILAKIVDSLTGYTVQDYIDPRFDLQQPNGNVWRLGASGQVVIEDVNGNTKETFTLTEEGKLFYLNNIADGGFIGDIPNISPEDARYAYLYYDSSTDMYYLKWTMQTIQSGTIGADLIPVWSASLILVPKEDFIGGNAILTNGNAEKMNYVYHPLDTDNETEQQAYLMSKYNLTAAKWKEYEDTFNALSDEQKAEYYNVCDYVNQKLNENPKVSEHDASSGTDDMYRKYEKKTVGDGEEDDWNRPIDQYISKGFPRTTVNVALREINVHSMYDVLYMGEVVSPGQLIADIEDKITDTYYLEYLKRYAYQRYLYDTTNDGVNLSLRDLLNKWLQFGNDEEYEKSFSIPYMYLPGVKYNEEDGSLILTDDGNGNKMATITNSSGFNTDKQGGKVYDKNGILADVVGILTYRWEQIEPTPNDTLEATKIYVKDDTERLRYAVTVGFTPLREGDTLYGYYLDADGEVCTASHDHADEDYVWGLNDYDDDGQDIFAGYLPIRSGNGKSEKWDWGDNAAGKYDIATNFEFAREARVNNIYITEKDEEGNTVFAWHPDYKPAVYQQQLQNDIFIYTETDDTVNLINDGRDAYSYTDESGNKVEVEDASTGDYRTLKGYSVYAVNVVSGGVALELNMLSGELEALLDENYTAEEVADDVVVVNTSFELNAKRVLVDSNDVKSWKDEGHLSDYGEDFKLTFTLTYKKGEIEEILKKKDKYGYVTVYAEATEVYGTWFERTVLKADEVQAAKNEAANNEFEVKTDEDGTSYKEEKQLKYIYEQLPIGSYTFTLSDANDQAFKYDLQFSTMSGTANSYLTDDGVTNDDLDRYQAAYEYFSDVVLNGLHTSNEVKDTVDGKYVPTLAQRRYDATGELVYRTEFDDDIFKEAGYIEDYEEATADTEGHKYWRDPKDNSIAYRYDSAHGVWRDAEGYKVPFYWTEEQIHEITLEDDEVREGEGINGAKYHGRGIVNYIADSTTTDDKDETTYYFGTTVDSTVKSYDSYYPGDRVGIVSLSTGNVKLIIHEEKGNENESFLYRITGKTLGGYTVDITVSVKGGGYTEIDIVAGNYTITEVSSWSWRYDDGEVKERDGGNPIPNGEDDDTWSNYSSGASATVKLTTTTGVVKNSKDGKLTGGGAEIWFMHDRNGKTWVGGEYYNKPTPSKDGSDQNDSTQG